ncbi:hypothetical protein [Streptomyces sp. NPDC059349]
MRGLPDQGDFADRQISADEEQHEREACPICTPSPGAWTETTTP